MRNKKPEGIRLVHKMYVVPLLDEGHSGDEVFFTGDDERFRVHGLGEDDKLTIAYKTLPEFAAYFRLLADHVDALHAQILRNKESEKA